jgi:hypothetical protein
MSFNGVVQVIPDLVNVEKTSIHTFTVPVDQTISLGLTVSAGGNKTFSVDSIIGTYTKPCPTPIDTPTPTPTPSPISTPTQAPSEDVELTVTDDPRFPVSGSAAIDASGLTYSLDTAPDQGNAAVSTDGSFTYTAANSRVTFDRFTVLASDGTFITVNVVLKIDKSIPTEGEVKPGGTKKGESSNLTSPDPTSTPGADEGDGGGSCTECD